jgi:hypothetical protein
MLGSVRALPRSRQEDSHSSEKRYSESVRESSEKEEAHESGIIAYRVNAFEKDARMIQHETIVSLWVGFVAALEDIVQTYNAGRRHPAKITRQTEKSIVIQCRGMHSPDDIFSVLTVAISAHLIDAEVVIRCLIQRWRAPLNAHPLTIDQETPIEFAVSGDRLCLDKQRLTPNQAAERLLGEALLS